MSKLGMLSAQLRAAITNPRDNKQQSSRTDKQHWGDKAEAKAERFLAKQGLKTLLRNFHCRFGEIDLIAEDQRHQEPVIVFVEVRFRKSLDFGGALASITAAKQRKLRHSAEYYCQLHNLSNKACRFDVICITGSKLQQIQWIENAF